MAVATNSSAPLFLVAGGDGSKNGGNAAPRLVAVHQRTKNTSCRRNLAVCAEHSDRNRGGEFLAGFALGGALFGTLAYIYGPKIQKAIRNEDDHGFIRPRRLHYQDDGLERTRQTLNSKIHQLNSAIDTVSTRLKDGNKAVKEQLHSAVEGVSSRLRGGNKPDDGLMPEEGGEFSEEEIKKVLNARKSDPYEGVHGF